MMRALLNRARRDRFVRDQRGATIIEFAIVAPVLTVLLMGTFDITHTLYSIGTLQGVIQKAGRDSGLEDGTVAARQTALDTRVRNQIHRLHRGAKIDITRRFYKSFSEAAAARAEQFTDSTPTNEECDNGESFIDENNNGVWDADGADGGQGGAKDSVLYTVKVEYPRMFPLHAFLHYIPDKVTLEAATILNNQPYSSQKDKVNGGVKYCVNP